MVLNQAYIFMIFIINGVIIGLLFDCFRVLRRTFKTNNITTYFQDVLFWILTGLILLYSIFTFSNGEIRLYMFLGVIVGCVLYMLLLSSNFIKINVKVLTTLKSIILTIIKIVLKPFVFLFKILHSFLFKPINFLIINTKKIKILDKMSKRKIES